MATMDLDTRAALGRLIAVADLQGTALEWAWDHAAQTGPGRRLMVEMAWHPQEKRAAVATYLGDPVTVPVDLVAR